MGYRDHSQASYAAPAMGTAIGVPSVRESPAVPGLTASNLARYRSSPAAKLGAARGRSGSSGGTRSRAFRDGRSGSWAKAGCRGAAATDHVSLGRRAAAKTFTRNNNNQVEPRKSRQASTRGLPPSRLRSLTLSQPRSLTSTSRRHLKDPTTNPNAGALICCAPALVVCLIQCFIYSLPGAHSSERLCSRYARA
jgi:hypothetical protein